MSKAQSIHLDESDHVTDGRLATNDLLTQMIERLRPLLGRDVPVKQRIVTFWSFIVESRHLAASDVVVSDFLVLAREAGLLDDLGSGGAEQIDHVIAWGLRGFNPFETGPLQ